jgi:hypothetical protein
MKKGPVSGVGINQVDEEDERLEESKGQYELGLKVGKRPESGLG